MNEAAPSPSRLARAAGAPSRAANQLAQRTQPATRRQVSRLCWAVLVGAVAWDVYLALDKTPDNTWSEAMRLASGRHPVLPWLVGLLVGHLFHPHDSRGPVIDRDAATTLLAGVTLVLTASGFAAAPWPLWWALALCLAGLLAASLLWPLERIKENWKW